VKVFGRHRFFPELPATRTFHLAVLSRDSDNHEIQSRTLSLEVLGGGGAGGGGKSPETPPGGFLLVGGELELG